MLVRYGPIQLCLSEDSHCIVYTEAVIRVRLLEALTLVRVELFPAFTVYVEGWRQSWPALRYATDYVTLRLLL